MLEGMDSLVDWLKDLPQRTEQIGREEFGKLNLADQNRKQLERGEDSEGNQLGKYGLRSKFERSAMGLQTAFIDLKRKGKFHRSIHEKETSEGFEIRSSDPKWITDISQDKRFTKALGVQKIDVDLWVANIVSRL